MCAKALEREQAGQWRGWAGGRDQRRPGGGERGRVRSPRVILATEGDSVLGTVGGFGAGEARSDSHSPGFLRLL